MQFEGVFVEARVAVVRRPASIPFRADRPPLHVLNAAKCSVRSNKGNAQLGSTGLPRVSLRSMAAGRGGGKKAGA